MLRFVATSIRRKLALLVLVAVLAAVGVAALATGVQQAARHVDNRKASVQAIAAALATLIAPSVADRRTRETARILAAHSRMPDITYVGVVDDTGRLVFEHGRGVVLERPGAPGAAPAPWFHLAAFLEPGHLIEEPVVYAGRRVGTLSLVADFSGLGWALIEGIFTALLIGLAAAVVGVGVALRLQGALTGPLRDLTRTMREVSETKDFARALERRSDDETGILVDAFNAMMREIRDRDSALTRHHEALEQTVAERTRDLDEARIAAERANAAKSEFLSTMSHEIRTPMNGMLVMAELLAAHQVQPRLARYADVVVKSGQSLLAIINDILDFSKIEAGRLELERISVSPRDLVDDALRLFAERAGSKGLDLAGYVAPAVPERIAADPLRLNQVLANLLNNALKFTEAGGVEIAVRLESAPAEPTRCRLSFSVRDTGIGIAPDKLATIFDAFSQADQSTTRRFGGTGIGLAICRRLAGCMDGRLEVASEPGAGATFTFTAPFEVLEPAASPAPLSEGPRPVAIIALDGEFSRRALADTFTDWGFAVTSAHAAAAAEAPAVIVADTSWFDSAAFETLCDDIATPVVAIGRNGDVAAERLVDAGRAVLVLDQPLTSGDMRRLARAALQGRQALQRVGLRDHAAAAVPAISHAGVRVLAADDSAVNREVLTEVLKRFDIAPTSVEDGEAAVDAAIAEPFDLIFMDCSMPGLDGYEATRRIRAAEQAAGRALVPIIALTAHVVGDPSTRARDAGMSDFVSKPFTLATIEACLARWLGPGAPVSERAAEAAKVSPRITIEGATQVSATGATDTVESRVMAAAPLLDGEVLDGIREIDGAGSDLLDRVTGLYREHAPRALARLGDLAGTGASPEACASAAHALKSLSRNIGAKRVGDMAGTIETAAHDLSVLPNAVAMAELATALSETLGALERLNTKAAA